MFFLMRVLLNGGAADLFQVGNKSQDNVGYSTLAFSKDKFRYFRLQSFHECSSETKKKTIVNSGRDNIL